MYRFVRPPLWLLVTIGFMILQVLLLCLSFEALPQLSVICAASHSEPFRTLGYVHFLYFGLIIFGLVSLFWPQGRPIYTALIVLSLLALPVQAYLVRSGQMYCDAP
ncbi:hypothetical protein WSK_0521 [Novosphingobium sp. Rr 2-17]|uniref:hypothetical protein n=1 Tax=Novosphingobium sp. Rr 2-17 TaxID=555793 RepID=UPI000269A169|nr:hypothetical protein [Novosphingobium sp. Rr 2-17]EIZ80839.1 hypothetical protein WSK_0521 [Novosphingobium sp. Rr 2-17]